jgi:dipeptidyl aminopeptidase/acylaminoacyl peptidase
MLLDSHGLELHEERYREIPSRPIHKRHSLADLFRQMRLVRAALLLVFPAALVLGSSPDDRQPTDPKSITSRSNPSVKPVAIEDLYAIPDVDRGSWSPDGKRIVFESDITGRSNIWKMRADGRDAAQLVRSEDRQLAPVWSPDGKWIIYQQDFGGKEIWDLFAVPVAGGEPVNLTDTPDVAESEAVWSPDGAAIAFSSKRKDSSITNLAILDWKTRHIRVLTNEQRQDRGWTAAAWSHDGKSLFASRGTRLRSYRNDADRNLSIRSDGDVYIIDLASGKETNLTEHSGDIYFRAVDISPDGKTALIWSNAQAGYYNIGLLDVATRAIRWVTNTQWETRAGTFSPDGARFSYLVNEDGRTRVFLVDTATAKATPVQMPEGVTNLSGNTTSFSPDNASLLLTYQNSRAPNDLWSYSIASSRAKQLTHSAGSATGLTALPQAQLVHYKSFDGTVISAFLWMPFNLQRNGSNPAIVLPHGGPPRQTSDRFDRDYAWLASRGYVCIAPNVRGSTGYGQKFQEMNIKDIGGGDLQDEVFAVKFLQATGFVDSRRVGITGGSYGGFMTLIALSKNPDGWAAGVDQYGPVSWSTVLQHSDPYIRQMFQSLLGDPATEARVYEDASPLKYIRGVRAPLLVLQGENDPRVPMEESEQVVNILKQEGRVVEVHYYPAEGHGFQKRENLIDAIKRTEQWFDRYLKGGPPSQH